MFIRSLGYRTELIFAGFDGAVRDAGEYIVVETPSNPSFHWGNFVFFPAPPRAGDLARWQEIFRRELPRCSHFAFGWDSPETGDVSELVAARFKIDENVVLTAGPADLRDPPHPSPDVEIRPIASDADWEQAIENQIVTREPDFALESYSLFKRRQFDRYRAMTARGLGGWFGAFVGDRLVADCGVYTDGSELGRFQSVGTHTDFRRRGICGTLVSAAARHAFARWRVTRLAMIADEHYHAARIYESVGFSPVEKLRGASWWNRAASPA